MDAGWDLAAFWPEFVAEVTANLETLEAGLLRLEDGDQAAIPELFRAAHTIKGAARMMSLDALAQIAARLEGLLEAMREAQSPVEAETVQACWQLVDAIRAELERAAPGGEQPQDRSRVETSSEGSPPTPAEPPEQALSAEGDDKSRHTLVAVRADLLDSLAATGKALHHHYLRLETLHAAFERHWRDLRRELSGSLASPRQKVIEEWMEAFETHLAALRVTLSQFEETALGLRLVPFGLLRTPILRLVREAARQLGKAVTCEIEGEETLIDRKLVQPLQDVLTHLLRNAVDHGIEPPDERERNGKPREGRIIVRAYPAHPMVVVEVSDDGRGIDPQAILHAALARGLISHAEAEHLPPQAALQLIFHPGFSTREEVSAYSGRGVGLDVVATTVRQLGGTVEVASAPGQGTTFILRWPLDLSLDRILVARAGQWAFGIPQNHVEAVLPADRVRRVRSAETTYVLWHGQLVPCRAVSLWFPAPEDGAHVVLTRTRHELVALTGATVVSLQELLIQPLPSLLARLHGVQAAALLGDGTPIAILDVDHLPRTASVRVRARGEATSPPERRRARGAILVVDDMFLTRDLLRSALSAAGYQVVTAGSAEEAVALLPQLADLAAVITDVHMPGMDGIALTRFLRCHPRWRDIPIVILSGDADPATVQAGLEAGANAYLTKKDFTQGTLLETVERVL